MKEKKRNDTKTLLILTYIITSKLKIAISLVINHSKITRILGWDLRFHFFLLRFQFCFLHFKLPSSTMQLQCKCSHVPEIGPQHRHSRPKYVDISCQLIIFICLSAYSAEYLTFIYVCFNFAYFLHACCANVSAMIFEYPCHCSINCYLYRVTVCLSEFSSLCPACCQLINIICNLLILFVFAIFICQICGFLQTCHGLYF